MVFPLEGWSIPTDCKKEINSAIAENDWHDNLFASLDKEEQLIVTSLSPLLLQVNINY